MSPAPLLPPLSLVAVVEEVLGGLLDLDPDDCVNSTAFLSFAAGGPAPPLALNLAHRYGGHQFGAWAGQLGDGRAVLSGEYVNHGGVRWEVGLKGSGRTPYSRDGDGRAVLRSSVRELLASEAMHHLGVPTSRAASLVVSEERVWRDQFYDGHPRKERAAIVIRLAPSWLRIGSLELLYFTGEHELLRQLADFIITHHFPSLPPGPLRYVQLLSTIANQTAELVARWQAVGFTHGVCNTDNFSLLSITIDYGPFGFMETFDPDFVPNSSDEEGRYRFSAQPHVALWNLEKLRQALSPLLQPYWQLTEAALRGYVEEFNGHYIGFMRTKLAMEGSDGERDESLIAQLLDIMAGTQADYSMTLRELSEVLVPNLLEGRLPVHAWALPRMMQHSAWMGWVRVWGERVRRGPALSYSEGMRLEVMQAANPCYVLRNYMAEVATRRAQAGDFSEVQRLLHVLQKPYERQREGGGGWLC